jgi:hypothetical protein
VSIMEKRNFLLNGNTGGTPAGEGGEPDASLRVVLVSAGLLLATLRCGR